MRIVMLYHSLVSDWNHGNAHFLRGVVAELVARGHDVVVLEPQDAWSRKNLVARQGVAAVRAFQRAFPGLASQQYDPRRIDLEAALAGADLVIVHEWNDPDVVRRVGIHRARGGRYRLLFHDTHHRAITDPDEARFEAVVGAIHRTGAMQYALDCAERECELARSALSVLHDSSHKRALLDLLTFVLERKH
mgnify:CR=1 FL=1